MPVETSSLFAKVIQDHLELKERNSQLEDTMPLGRYKIGDPFDNHALFKSEEQARLEDTMEGGLAAPVEEPLRWPGENTEEHPAPGLEDSFWSRTRDFDWGD